MVIIMKKKLVAMTLAICITCSLIGCQKETSVVSTQVTTEASSVAEIESEEETVTSSEITLAEQEVYNDNGIVVTVTGIDTNSMWGTDISVLVENSSEQNVTVQTRNGSINGYMMDFQMSCDVAAGKKANDN